MPQVIYDWQGFLCDHGENLICWKVRNPRVRLFGHWILKCPFEGHELHDCDFFRVVDNFPHVINARIAEQIANGERVDRAEVGFPGIEWAPQQPPQRREPVVHDCPGPCRIGDSNKDCVALLCSDCCKAGGGCRGHRSHWLPHWVPLHVDRIEAAMARDVPGQWAAARPGRHVVPNYPPWRWNPATYPFWILKALAERYERSAGRWPDIIVEILGDQLNIPFLREHDLGKFQENMRQLIRGKDFWDDFEDREDIGAWFEFTALRWVDDDGIHRSVDRARDVGRQRIRV